MADDLVKKTKKGLGAPQPYSVRREYQTDADPFTTPKKEADTTFTPLGTDELFPHTPIKPAAPETGAAQEDQASFDKVFYSIKTPKGLQEEPDLQVPELQSLKPAMAEFQNSINAAMAAYKQETDNVKSAKMWDGIIKGITLMAAGLYGLKTGNYATGVKLEPANFEEEMQAARAQLEASTNAALRKYGMNKDEIEKAKDQYRLDADYANKVYQKNQKLWDRAENEAGRKLQADMANQRTKLESESIFAKGTAKAGKDKVAMLKDQLKLSREKEKEVNKILGSDPDKVSDELKAQRLSVLLNMNVKPEDIQTDKPGLFTGDYGWDEVKAKLYQRMSQGGQAPATGGQTKTINGVTYQKVEGGWQRVK